MKIIFRTALIGLCVTALVACRAPKTNDTSDSSRDDNASKPVIKESIIKAAKETFEAYGFTGTVAVDEYESNFPADSLYSVYVDYTEMIDGRAVTVSEDLDYIPENHEENPDKMWEMVDFDTSVDKMRWTFEHIADKAMWGQPDAKILEQDLTAVFSQYQYEGVTFEGVSTSINDEAPELSSLYQHIDANRQAGRPFQGFYDIPIPEFMANDVLSININYHLYKKEPINDTRERLDFEDKALENLIGFLHGADYSQVPDGLYTVGFSTEIGGTLGMSMSNVVEMRIRDHQVVDIVPALK